MATPCKCPPAKTRRPRPAVAVVILAGGQSSRMGRDKARLSLGGRSLLAWIRSTSRLVSPRVRVVRRDRVPACGPLGGVVTVLQRPPAPRLLFLSCDMPWVEAGWLRRLTTALRGKRQAVFTEQDGLAGFPFAIEAGCRAAVEEQLHRGSYSLQALADALQARRLRVPGGRAAEFRNINTPAELQAAREHLRQRRPHSLRPDSLRRPQSSKTRTRRRPAR
jgi:molybdenum cofactor guanylyltransferase